MSFLDSDTGQFWFTVTAYISAILPWTAISSTDFIKASWRSVKHTRKAGYRDLLWTFLPRGYVIFYAVKQYQGGEHSELCASAIAALLAALLGLRTIWGLWQLREFRKWAERSIAALDVTGVKYCLHGYDEHAMSKRTFAEISDEILVNEKIADNQILHGDVHCYLRFGSTELLRSHEEDAALLGPVFAAVRWVTFLGAMFCEYVLRVVGKRRRKLKQVPMKPADVWIHWAATFASQGLKDWISDCEVAIDPRVQVDNIGIPLSKQFQKKGAYFGAELLASATLHCVE
ncbi:hypothetical protein FGB62_2g345 [Gracilaria domingensis]|nr:hypothetical protein FGB62_2g345 [Gracilaria domingensis]